MLVACPWSSTLRKSYWFDLFSLGWFTDTTSVLKVIRHLMLISRPLLPWAGADRTAVMGLVPDLEALGTALAVMVPATVPAMEGTHKAATEVAVTAAVVTTLTGLPVARTTLPRSATTLDQELPLLPCPAPCSWLSEQPCFYSKGLIKSCSRDRRLYPCCGIHDAASSAWMIGLELGQCTA